MDGIVEVRDILGLTGKGRTNPSPLHLVDLTEKGFPVSTVDQISKRIAPSDAAFKYRIVPKATFARVKANSARLSSTQSAVVARLAKIWLMAHAVWGSDEATRSFLVREHQLLDGRRPIDVAMENEIGGELVREILGRLQHGSAL